MCVLYGLSCSVFLLIIFLAVSSAVLAGMQLVFFLPIFQSFDPFPSYQSERNLPFACAVVLNNQTHHRQSGHSSPSNVWSPRCAMLPMSHSGWRRIVRLKGGRVGHLV